MDSEQVFQALSVYYLNQESHPYDSLMVTCVTALRHFGNRGRNLGLLRRTTTLYSHMVTALQVTVPKVENESIHCFIKEVMTIIYDKGWAAMCCSGRNHHVERIWQKIVKSRYTSQTLVVQSLLKADKLWEAVNLVYVWTLMDYHPNPYAIYNWALRLLLQMY